MSEKKEHGNVGNQHARKKKPCTETVCTFGCKSAQKAAYVKAAQKAEVPFSVWCRRHLDAAAERAGFRV